MPDTEKIKAPAQPERVLGWDLLRGMCALAVASYHLMYWQGIATVHTLGSYGVYLFFILSGASLAYSYVDKFEAGQFSFGEFLRTRYLRLAPLYLALMLAVLPWKLLKGGSLADVIASYFLNATFLFGFFNPATNAVLVGGWSLGIEAIFYLLFPCLMLTFRRTWLAAGVLVLLLAVQIGWIAMSLGQPASYAQNSALYFQAPAFIGYFMGGCVLGVAKRKGLLNLFQLTSRGWATVLAGFALMILINPLLAGHEIVGWRGWVLGATCFAMVYAASRSALSASMNKLASRFGDATYGLYLLHPVLFFGLVQIIFPRVGVANPEQWALPVRLLFGCWVIAAAFWLALLSEKHFEKPIRQYFKVRIFNAPKKAARL